MNLHEEWFMNLMKQLKEVNKSRNIAYDVMNRPVRNPAWEGDFMGDGMLYQEWQMSKLYSKLGDEIETAQNRDVILVKNIRGEKHPNRLAYPQQVFSISANSTQKDRAFRFLETLLDFGAQQWCDGLPMNAEAMERQWFVLRSMTFKKEAVHEYEKMHRAIIEDIDSVYANEYVNAAVIKQLQEYLDDKISLEESLTKAEHDVRIILNE